MDNQSGHLHLHNQPTLLQVTVQLIYYKGVTCVPLFPVVLDLPPSFSSAIRSVRAVPCTRAILFLLSSLFPKRLILLLMLNLFCIIWNLLILKTNVRNHFSLIFKEFWKTSWALGIGLWWERICSDIFCGSFVFKGRTPFNCVFCLIKETRFGKKLTNKPMLSSFQHTKPHPFQSIWHIYMDRCRQT